MIIANPLYDTAFKGLAQDPEVAKAIIETLLETEVLDVQLGATEYNKRMQDDDRRPKCFRVDYLAVVKTKGGETQKILIEVQKASGSEDILRFREYVATAGYMPKSKDETPFPIVTIYFLGFKLRNVEAPCLKVSRQYIDMLKNEVLETKEKFVELLTHDSYVIQAPRIKTVADPQTELERILSVFEQSNFADSKEETINYKYPIEGAYHKKMIDILHYIGTDPDERRQLDMEAYWERYDYHHSGKLAEAMEDLAEAEEMLVKKNEVIAEKDGVIAEKDEIIENLKRQIEEMKR
jgi:hypothetical protein